MLYYIIVENRVVLDIFSYSLACNSHAVLMYEVKLSELVHESRDTACKAEIFHMVVTAWAQLAQVRSALAYSVKHIEIQLDACLMSDSREVKNCICRASHSHIDSYSVLKSIRSKDIARTDVSSEHFHYLHTCSLSEADTFAAVAQSSTVVRKTHTKDLSKRVHAVCSEQA